MEVVMIVLLVLNMALLGAVLVFMLATVGIVQSAVKPVEKPEKRERVSIKEEPDSLPEEDQTVPLEQFTPDFSKPIKFVPDVDKSIEFDE